MPETEKEQSNLSPAQQALKKFRALVKEDSSLNNATKNAILEDLGSENPHFLKKLRATIGTPE